MTLDRLMRRSIYSLPCNSITPFKKDETQISSDLEKSEKVAISLPNTSFSLKTTKSRKEKDKKNSRWEPYFIEELIRSI